MNWGKSWMVAKQTSELAIETDNLVKVYREGQIRAVDGLSLKIAEI